MSDKVKNFLHQVIVDFPYAWWWFGAWAVTATLFFISAATCECIDLR